ncbi:hypothetical protein RF11_13287 [Thelohanellus kitauei]|uniref:Uncharacterized protein n=1 Tax=Thelohanellus kitauei TaxID=669202 RepID=A0A0C2MIN5_THEKT|nr:hypothetical protein RF11_13287 [Thelohanellus kitauei]
MITGFGSLDLTEDHRKSAVVLTRIAYQRQNCLLSTSKSVKGQNSPSIEHQKRIFVLVGHSNAQDKFTDIYYFTLSQMFKGTLCCSVEQPLCNRRGEAKVYRELLRAKPVHLRMRIRVFIANLDRINHDAVKLLSALEIRMKHEASSLQAPYLLVSDSHHDMVALYFVKCISDLRLLRTCRHCTNDPDQRNYVLGLSHSYTTIKNGSTEVFPDSLISVDEGFTNVTVIPNGFGHYGSFDAAIPDILLLFQSLIWDRRVLLKRHRQFDHEDLQGICICLEICRVSFCIDVIWRYYKSASLKFATCSFDRPYQTLDSFLAGGYLLLRVHSSYLATWHCQADTTAPEKINDRQLFLVDSRSNRLTANEILRISNLLEKYKRYSVLNAEALRSAAAVRNSFGMHPQHGRSYALALSPERQRKFLSRSMSKNIRTLSNVGALGSSERASEKLAIGAHPVLWHAND